MASRSNNVSELREAKMLGWSYRKSIKPVVMKGLPKFTYATLVHDPSKDPPNDLVYTTDLDAIPEDLINLGLHDEKTLLRQDGFTTWQEIKAFHKKLMHRSGRSEEQFRQECLSLDLGLDGVQESKKGIRTFLIVSLRVGNYIYIIAIYNPLLSNNLAKPSATEVLRFEIAWKK